MPRGNGSYLGQTANPNSNVASGIWTVREAEAYLRADKWPAQPTVPSAPTGAPGDGQVALTWTAPTGGSPVTDYVVQYSSNGGSSWTTFSDGVSTATSATVTGLTNGTGYIFRIIAVNALGQGPAGSASGTVTPAPVIASLLLHFDGTNGSTNIVDSSGNAHAATARGNAAISTAQSKFGGASLYCDGDGDDVSAASAASVSGTEDYTVDFWLYPQSITPGTGYSMVLGYPDSQALLIGIATDGYIFTGYSQVAIDHTASSNPVALNEWSHVAVTRSGTTLRIFVNGVLALTGTDDRSYTQRELLIGGDNGANTYFQGYIDELRIKRGTAEWTAAFTPPYSPYG